MEEPTAIEKDLDEKVSMTRKERNLRNIFYSKEIHSEIILDVIKSKIYEKHHRILIIILEGIRDRNPKVMPKIYEEIKNKKVLLIHFIQNLLYLSEDFAKVILDGNVQTYDMKKMKGSPDVIKRGAATTKQMADAIIQNL